MRESDEIGDDQKVPRKAQGGDDLELLIEAGPVRPRLPFGAFFTKTLSEPPPQTFTGETVEIDLGRLSRGNGDAGDMLLFKPEVQVAPLADLERIDDGLGADPEPFRHLRRGLEVKLRGRKVHPVAVLKGLSGLDAEEHLVGPGVLALEVVTVIRGDRGNSRLPADLLEPFIEPVLVLHAVGLELQEEAFPVEDPFVLPGRFDGPPHLPRPACTATSPFMHPLSAMSPSL